MEAMLDFLSLSLPETVKKEAAQFTIRMLEEIELQTEKMQGYFEIYWD
jgi:hypothetical protein